MYITMPREAEHRLGKAARRTRASAGASSSGSMRQRDAEEHAEHDDLQHLRVGDRLGDVLREDVEHDVLPRACDRPLDLRVASTRGGSVMPTPARLT